MDKKTTTEKAHSAKMMGALCVESFLNENYHFRRNVLNGKREIEELKVAPGVFRPLTQEVLNSIILKAKREDVCEEGSPKQDIELYVHSEEVARLQEMNQNYTQQKDLAKIVEVCFRKPADNEVVKAMNSGELLEIIRQEYPSVPTTHSTRVQLGLAMKELGFEHIHRGHVPYYQVLPRKAS